MITAWYGQQSCTAGRAAFLTRQSPIRTGLTKVGVPGADVGLSAKDPTIAEVLKPLGYATAQFGKNHLDDRNEFLPCVHGFDEFFGNLYHLNAEEERENSDYPKSPVFRQHFGPRGMLHCWASAIDDATVDPSFEKVGRQRIENTRPPHDKAHGNDRRRIHKRRCQLDGQTGQDRKTVLLLFQLHADAHTHLKPQSQGKTGLGVEPDGMVEHDGQVGQLLKELDDLRIANNTIVVYTGDNGAEVMTWPDGGSTPFRGEEATNWEGGYRVPTLIRWPIVIQPGAIYNDFFAHEDLLRTFAAATGNAKVVEQLKSTCQLGNKSFHVHLDGYNLLPFFRGEVKESPRNEFLYWSDDGDLFALRYDNWKIVFIEQNHEGLDIWMPGFNKLRVPKIFNLRADPFERGDSSFLYNDWMVRRAFINFGAQGLVATGSKASNNSRFARDRRASISTK